MDVGDMTIQELLRERRLLIILIKGSIWDASREELDRLNDLNKELDKKEELW